MVRADRKQPLVPSFELELHGTVLGKDTAGWIVNVTVEDELDVPGMFAFELASREDERGSMPWTDDTRFQLGMAVKVGFGYGSKTDTVLAGEITALEPRFSSSGPPTLTVRGYDTRHRLNTVRRTRTFIDQRDSEIVKKIGEEAGLTVHATNSKVVHPYVLQAGRTDLDFLIERARRIQFELVMLDGELFFRPVANASEEVLALSFKDDLLEFEPRLSLTPATRLQIFGWDAKAKQPIDAVGEPARNEAASSTADPAEDKTEGRARRTRSGVTSSSQVIGSRIESSVSMPVASQAEADQLAQAHFDAMTLDFIRGDGRCRGCTGVRAGTVIRIDGAGKRFSGLYYVTSALHSYTRRDGYLTQFQVRRNEW
jgi:phage protein D